MGHNFESYCKCYEKIENYQKAKADNFKGWNCHHRLETHNSDGERRLVDITKKELKALGMYYGRPPEELVFLTSLEHNILHKKGKPISEEHKNKIREAKKGKYTGENHPMYGKHLSEETRKKLSEASKGKHLSAETKHKISKAKKGKHLSEETKKKMSEALKGKYTGEKSSMYGKTHSEEAKKKIGEAQKGKPKSEEHKNKIREAKKGIHWFNNGKINTMAKECPDGFVPGKLLI